MASLITAARIAGVVFAPTSGVRAHARLGLITTRSPGLTMV